MVSKVAATCRKLEVRELCLNRNTSRKANQLLRKRETMVRNSNTIDANEPFLGTWGFQNQMERAEERRFLA